jgi:RimJ/RimL family protein N-acetyltransferase
VSGAAIIIRSARIGDIPELYACLTAVAREARYLAFAEAPPFAESEKYWTGMIARGCPFQVVLDGERIAGWCDIAPIQRPNAPLSGKLGIGLHANYRGQGLGRKLLEATVDAAWRYGIERIELTVFADNRRARRLYDSFGFTAQGVLQHDGGNGHDDSLLMALSRH